MPTRKTPFRPALSVFNDPPPAVALSVILPCYKAAELARRSVMRLTHALAGRIPSYEIIVVDDGVGDCEPVLRDLPTGPGGQVHVITLPAEAFLARVAERFQVEPVSGAVKPGKPGEFGLFVAGRWHRLTIRPELVPANELLARLDVRLLSDHLLQPVLGITDNGRDKRLAYVGGSHGVEELERRVRNGGMAAAVSLFPTQMADVMAVSDAGGVMPPKSTWFAPKLVDGLISHVLD